MAFGSFFKKILTGAKNLVNKVAPIVRKGLDAVSKAAPFIQAGATAIGGPIGGVANTIGSYAGKASTFLDKVGIPRLTGQRFDVPLLKSD